MNVAEPSKWLKHFQRVKRWHVRLSEPEHTDKERRVDDFYAFFVCAYHLKDWIKNDDALPERLRGEVETFLSGSASLLLAGDIANGFKHLKRDERKARRDPGARVSAMIGFQLDAFQLDAFQLGGIVVLGDLGTSDAKQLADGCLEEWTYFLRARGLV